MRVPAPVPAPLVIVLLPGPRAPAPAAPSPAVPLVHHAGRGLLTRRVLAFLSLHVGRRRSGSTGGGIGVLGDAVAPAMAGLVPGPVVVMMGPPGRGAGADEEPEEARCSATTPVSVMPVVPGVHGRKCYEGCALSDLCERG